MPTREPIVNNLIPREIEKPIPVRTISTRTGPRPFINQETPNVGVSTADSVPTAESVKLSPQISALARKEQAFRQREQAVKEREKALDARLADADQYSQLKAKISAKDYSAAEELGLTYEEYTKYLLDKQSGENPEDLRFKAMEDEIQALKKSKEESAAQEYEDTVAEYHKELKTLADSDPQFSKVKKFKETDSEGKEVTGIDVALKLILDSWEEDGTEVTIEQALKDTELFFNEQATKWSALRDEPKEEQSAKTLPPPKIGSKTLTQQMQATGIEKKPAKSLQYLSESERYAEARRRVLERRQLEGR